MKIKGMTARERYHKHQHIDTVDGIIMFVIGTFFTFGVGGFAMFWGIPALLCAGLSFRDAGRAKVKYANLGSRI